MTTNIYETPELSVFEFAVETGFASSKIVEGANGGSFGNANSGDEDDWGDDE